ncbi:alpha-mannosidase 2-like [Ornithodoros turicata]|uniref:alpha-mannosidase 2-like n=1 Tax=Ornithodoros turicata TaxID=34597 RepID=UPI003138B6B7
MIKCTTRKTKVRAVIFACIAILSVVLVMMYHSYSTDEYHLSRPVPVIDGSVRGSTNMRNSSTAKSTSGFRWPWSKAKSSLDECHAVPKRVGADIDTPDLYAKLNFESISVSFWNQTFEKRYYDTRRNWDKLPLEVIVVPHSHNDPGWLKTFEGYFLSSTAHVLNNMVDFLHKHRDFSFIWAEVCFFSRWWRSLQNRPHLREAVRELVTRGQLEMVTGGWVMTDEAVVHYYAMLDQLIEGHQWLHANLGISPRSGWSIDPFGHGSTVPYLLHASGIRNTFIQRTHYAWKRYLAARQQLEFLWQTPFLTPTLGSTDILCHMSPFELYSIKHTCGPDKDVCLKFDFRRIAGEFSESRSMLVTEHNVDTLAELLLGQYGRIGSLFPHNVAFVPLGDDFRYDHDVEWMQQYENYKKLFDHINSNEIFHAHIRFGTLNDYFQIVHKRMEKLEFPSLTGDFHAYGDVYGDGKPSYWTGYYTTRPYMKHFARELEHWLRAAEIIYSVARPYLAQAGMPELAARMDADYVFLVQARDSLGLFQHHDAITGTSKENVMSDYGSRMYHGMKEAMGVVAHSAQLLMLQEEAAPDKNYRLPHPTSYLFPDLHRMSYDVLPVKTTLTVPGRFGRKIVLYNSHAQPRSEVVRVHVQKPISKILDPAESEVPFQINPVWNDAAQMSSDRFEVLFVADMSPVSLSTYTLLSEPRPGGTAYRKTQVALFVSDAWENSDVDSIFSFEGPATESIQLSTPYLTATFSHLTGLLTSVKLHESGVHNNINLSYRAYQSLEFHSGAYLFQPDLNKPFVNVTGRFPIIRVIRGPIMSEVIVTYPGAVIHTCRVYHLEGPLGGGIEMSTVFDLSSTVDFNIELFMKLDTDIDNKKTFYTDSAGFQMMRRHTNVDLPIQANYYPITSAVYMEDTTSRLTLLVSHAHGTASIQPGSIEVMLDRKVRYDDSRGLGEGVTDVRRTVANFWLLLEEQRNTESEDIPNLSFLAHTLSTYLNYPAVILATEGNQNRALYPKMTFLNGSYPCETFMLNLKTTPIAGNFDQASQSSLLILHQKGSSCQVRHLVPHSCQQTELSDFTHLKVHSIHRTMLTGTRNLEKVSQISEVNVPPMEIATLNVTFGA